MTSSHDDKKKPGVAKGPTDSESVGLSTVPRRRIVVGGEPKAGSSNPLRPREAPAVGGLRPKESLQEEFRSGAFAQSPRPALRHQLFRSAGERRRARRPLGNPASATSASRSTASGAAKASRARAPRLPVGRARRSAAAEPAVPMVPLAGLRAIAAVQVPSTVPAAETVPARVRSAAATEENLSGAIGPRTLAIWAGGRWSAF